jgi:serine/threonine protein kinase/WD40 repeat protein
MVSLSASQSLGDASPIADQTKTLRADEAVVSSSPQTPSTDHFATSGSAGKTDGSDAQLKKVWDAAIGSSGKESKQSLRYDRPQASDSIFDRIAARNVADANSADAERADYQIRDKVGEGAMGIVYSALQTAVNRIVAVKTIKAEHAKHAVSRRNFFYEASITADLDHPNIPAIYEFGVAGDGLVFYAMKLIAGTGWHNVIRKRTLAENLEIFSRVADAVAFAHSRNIIHRDLKPENVIVGNYGEVYLTDWGLAINLTDNPEIAFGGTPDYMAPEMAANRGSRVGKHSDVYLLGAILFQIVTGKPPHAGLNQRERLGLAKANVIVETDSNDPLLDVARHAMNTQPEDRYASIADMQTAIREILKHNDSIELSHRAEELTNEAIQSNSNELFNRAIFGFRDALELWGGNEAAKTGLQNARLAYAQFAVDQGNYDVAMQTLDERNPKESSLYAKAKNAKLQATQREQRIKRTRRIFAGVVATLLLMLTGASFVAYNSAKGENAALAAAAESANLAAESAKKAENAAKELLNEEKDKLAALEQLELTRLAKEKSEKEAKEKIEAQEQIAKAAKEKADQAEKDRLKADVDNANKLAQAALESAAKIDLAAQPQKFNLAISKIRQYDLQGAMELLDQIQSAKLSGIGELAPSLSNWAFNRVSLLSNQDLPKQPLGEVKAIDFATDANVGVAGNVAGQVSLLRFENGQIIEQAKKQLGSSIDAVIVSPDGSNAMVATQSASPTVANGKVYELFSWNLKDGSEPTKVSETGNRSFQGFSYSPDGKTVLAGINQGLWIRNPAGIWSRVSKNPGVDIRGELQDIGWLTSTQVVVLARLNNVNHVHTVNLPTGEASMVKLPQELLGRITALSTMGTDRVLLGLTDGNMESYRIQDDRLSDRRELTKQHRAPIVSIRPSGKGKFVSRSNEPVAHVWKSDAMGNLEHETYLTSAPSTSARGNNVANIAFVDKDTAVTVDTLGNAVALSIERQKQRRLVARERAVEPGQIAAPVASIHPRGKSSLAIAVDENGVADLWNLQTGKSAMAGNAFSYFGHTPGATLVDSEVDLDAGVIVTAASLRDATRAYLPDPSHYHEYCFWDYRTGNMLRRWTEPGTETGLPRISLIEPGKLLTSSETAKLIDYSAVSRGGDLVFPDNQALAKKLPDFSLTHPKIPGLVAMVNSSGALLLWDQKSELKNWTTVGDRGELPLRGAWSVDGEDFYVVVNSGVIYRSRLAGSRFEKSIRVGAAKMDDASLIASHHAIDLNLERQNDQDLLHCAIRLPRQTSLTSMTITKDGKTSNVKSSVEPGIHWYDPEQKQLTSRVGKLAINERQRESILSASRIGAKVFVTTRHEGVYSIATGSGESSLTGVAKFVNSTADRMGQSVWMLRSDGVVLRLDISEQGVSQWKRLEYSLPSAKRIEVSPDGSTLAVLMDNQLKLVSVTDGKEIQTLAAVSEFAWDPNSDNGLGAVTKDGSILTVGIPGVPGLAPVRLNGATIKSVHFFDEKWSDAKQKPYRYLLVQTEVPAKENGELHFVRLDAPLNPNKIDYFIGKIPNEAQVAVSPVDSVIATGETTGTIRIWFASPEYESLGELYDLESERDAAMKRIAFADGGDTLVTSDEKGRLYGWLSKDKQGFNPR